MLRAFAVQRSEKSRAIPSIQGAKLASILRALETIKGGIVAIGISLWFLLLNLRRGKHWALNIVLDTWRNSRKQTSSDTK